MRAAAIACVAFLALGGCDDARPAPHPTAPGPLPDTSVYQLEASFEAHDGTRLDLESLRGRPVLIGMFYASCTSICPVLISDARRVERAMTPAARERLRVVFVTIDPERDTRERLQELARERELPPARWTLARGSEDDTRQLAMILGVQYRRTSASEFAHSALLLLLDRDGNVDMQIEGIGQPVGALAARASELAR